MVDLGDCHPDPLLAVALLASLDVASVRRELMTPAGGLPVLLWASCRVGMLWADVEWSERFHGLRGYHKLLGIPLLLAHFRRSERVQWVIFAFLFSRWSCSRSRGLRP